MVDQVQRLSDVINLIGGGTPKRSISEYWNGEIPWLSVKDFNHGGRYVEESDESITQLGLKKSSTKLLQPGMLIISARGTVGELAQLKSEMAFNQSCYGIDAKTQYLNNNYLYYLLKLKIRELRAIAHGSVFDTITRDTFENIEVEIPKKNEQKAIVHILGSLDDKIEINQKMNQTLEEIAKAIFKSWFVNFDPVRAKAEGRSTGLPPEISDLFPDELVESEIGEIPKGWESKRVEEICEKIAMGPFGSNIKVSTFVDEGVPIISGHHLHNLLLKEGNHKFITEDHAEKLKNSLVRSGDVVFTHAGTVGQVSLIPKKCDYSRYVISQRQFYARPVGPEYGAFLNFFFHTAIGQHKLLSNVSGSGVPSIARPSSHLKAIELTIPDEVLVHKFDQTVGPMIDRMVLISEENETLSELRDTLLPKLISGELRIPDVEKFLEEAGI
jgi:type I restriction enzyme, S subunit